jgi:hypothetical protein
MVDRLFVPLNSKAFGWFKSMGKKFELRNYGRQWTEKHIYSGRSVELRRGYSVGDSLWGTIGKIVTGDINEIYSKINFIDIIPIAKNKEDAIEITQNIMGDNMKYIAFEVMDIHTK